MAIRGLTLSCSPPLLFLHRHQLPAMSSALRPWNSGRRTTRTSVFSRYSQAPDMSTRIQDNMENLPKLVEDIFQTTIGTGPRGALRLAQGIQAVIGVGGEWLNDVSKALVVLVLLAAVHQKV